jgi:hypothetical protein
VKKKFDLAFVVGFLCFFLFAAEKERKMISQMKAVKSYGFRTVMNSKLQTEQP